MKIYIAHSREFDYEHELYLPIREDQSLPQADIILPHEPEHNSAHGRDFYQQLDLIIAEVSYPATGLGIELGWASDSQVPIVCIHKKDCRYSGSLYAVTNKFYEYITRADLIQLIRKIINEAQQ